MRYSTVKAAAAVTLLGISNVFAAPMVPLYELPLTEENTLVVGSKPVPVLVALFGLSNVFAAPITPLTEDPFTEDLFTEDPFTEDPFTEDSFTEDPFTEECTLNVFKKPVPDLAAHGYTVTKGHALPNKPITYTIKKEIHKNEHLTVDQIRIDLKENSLSVLNADNKKDTSSNKLFLSDIEMALWVHTAKKKVTDLVIIRFEVIVEDATTAVIKDARKLLKVGNDGHFTVTATETGNQKTVFNHLQGTPLGKSVARLHSDFDARQAASYSVTGSALRPNIEIHLH